jgi:hypothetical protein
MISPSSVAGSQSELHGDAARRHVEKLVAEKMLGRKIDAVSFMDELLSLAAQLGQLTCTPASNRALRFAIAGCDPFEVDVDGNKGKLRMLCARLAVLCQENGHDPMVYGGEGTVGRTEKVPLLARWTNTTDKQEFTISVVR